MSKVLRRLLASTVSVIVGLPLLAAGSAPIPVLRVRVYNVAHVGSRDLAEAERVADAIFEQGGIATGWKEGAADNKEELSMDFSSNLAPSGRCVTPPAGEIMLQFLNNTPKRSLPGSLGFALPCATFGITVTVFVDRCEGVLRVSSVSLSQVLGHVMAHEIGHMLLGPNSHTTAGIMSERWAQADWMMVSRQNKAFLLWQATRIRETISGQRNGENFELTSGPAALGMVEARQPTGKGRGIRKKNSAVGGGLEPCLSLVGSDGKPSDVFSIKGEVQ